MRVVFWNFQLINYSNKLKTKPIIYPCSGLNSWKNKFIKITRHKSRETAKQTLHVRVKPSHWFALSGKLHSIYRSLCSSDQRPLKTSQLFISTVLLSHKEIHNCHRRRRMWRRVAIPTPELSNKSQSGTRGKCVKVRTRFFRRPRKM